jgi:hypothetical protein
VNNTDFDLWFVKAKMKGLATLKSMSGKAANATISIPEMETMFTICLCWDELKLWQKKNTDRTEVASAFYLIMQ